MSPVTLIVRRVLAYIPTNVGGARPHGLVLVSVDTDGHFYVERDFTGTRDEVDAKVILEAYLRDDVDCIVYEKTPVGDPPSRFEDAAEQIYGLLIEDVDEHEQPDGRPSTLFVKAIPRDKEHRRTVSRLGEHGRVHLVSGVPLDDLIRELTTEQQRGTLIPAAVRALTIAIIELLGANARIADASEQN